MSLNRPDPRPAAVRALVPVVAVVVTRGPTPYLAPTLDALADQSRPPQRVILVDAARGAEDADALAPFAARLTVPVTLVATPGVRTFGGAVRAALAAEASAGEDPGWLWLLHDDSAPAPDALAELLAAVERAPSVAVAGAKQHTWDPPARVVEVGVTTSRFGRRMTGIDAPEVDQGQHDARDDVLGVGIAGALVRRDVWEDLGGTDPSLGPFGDGVDLSRRARLAGHRVVVVPSAVVRHARAAFEGLRPDWDARRSAQARREAFLHAQLVAVPVWALPAIALLAVASSLVRALGRLVLKEPGLVAAELAAPWAALARLGRVARARRRAARTRRVARRTLRPLQATWRDVASQVRDRRLSAAATRRARQVPSELEQREMAQVRRGRRLALVGVLAAAVAVDVVLLGTWFQRFAHGDRLVGGSLLIGDADVGELWRAATSWWAGAGHGGAAAPDPLWVALLPGTALAGSLGRAAVAGVLLAVPLAALGAWFAAGAATRSRALRAWAALVWAAAPALLVPLAEVRLGAVLAHVALPWVVLGVARGVGVARVDAVESGLVGAARLEPRADGPTDATSEATTSEATTAEATTADATTAEQTVAEETAPEETAPDAPGSADGVADPVAPEPDRALRRTSAAAEPSLAAAAGAALAFVLVTAAAPVLLPAGVVAVLLLLPVARRRGRLLWLPVPALALHGPLVVAALTTTDGWRALLAEPGAPVATDPAPSWQQLLGWPVTPDALPGPWTSGVAAALPLVATGVVVALALPALVLRPPSGRAARVGWLVVLVGLAAALAATRVVVGVADGTTTVASAAPGLSLALAGLLVAVLPGAGRLRTALSRHSFGWRQVVVGVLALVAAAGPATVLGTALADRADVDLTAVDGHVVPAVGRQLQRADGLRVLALEPTDHGVVATVLRQDGRQLTDVSRLVTATAAQDGRSAADTAVAAVAARLAAGTSTDVGAELDGLGIGAVLLPPGPDGRRGDLAGRLDATPGLERVTATAAGTIWRSTGIGAGTAGWARVVDGTAAGGRVLAALPGGQDGRLDTRLPAGAGARVLVLAETADGDWRATLDGRSLRAVDAGWQQAFELGPQGGHLVVSHDPPTRTPWLVLQAAVVLVTVLLALPVRRRR